MMALIPMLAKKLLKTRLPRGREKRRYSGMTGLAARCSTRRRIAPAITAIMSEAITKGCFQGNTFPPKFRPAMRNATDPVRRMEPEMSKPLRACLKPWPDRFARFGPRVEGVVKYALMNMATKTGIWTAKVSLHPSLSQRNPPKAAPNVEPLP